MDNFNNAQGLLTLLNIIICKSYRNHEEEQLSGNFCILWCFIKDSYMGKYIYTNTEPNIMCNTHRKSFWGNITLLKKYEEVYFSNLFSFGNGIPHFYKEIKWRGCIVGSFFLFLSPSVQLPPPFHRETLFKYWGLNPKMLYYWAISRDYFLLLFL